MSRLQNLELARSVKAERQARGIWCGENVRYGWTVLGGELVENPYEQTILAEIKRLRERGRTYAVIARVLTTCGAKTRSGKPWNKQVISKIFKRNIT
jgi:hypothetical protein